MSKQQANKTARFWIWENGDWVKLSIRPGQTLSHAKYHRHDEGWSDVYASWENLGGVVERSVEIHNQDCDGRHGESYTDTCLIEELTARDTKIEGTPLLPRWQEMSAENYDQYAELAGY